MFLASSLPSLVLGGAFYGVGHSVITVSTMAMAIDRADPLRRGAAMGTYSAACSTGQGIGALIAGVAADAVGYAAIYVGAAAAMAVGLALTAANWAALTGPQQCQT